MMYSASTGGFYPADYRADLLPEDVVPITGVEHQALLAGQSAGQQIVAGEDGRPTLRDYPAAPAPVPPEITRRQMLLAMTAAGLITPDEALAAATTGAVPAAIDAVFGALPADQALAARITWATMSVAARDHELILVLIAAALATPAEVDAIFVAGAAIP